MPGFHEEEEGEGMGATGVDHMCRRENDSNGGDDDEDVSEAGPWTSAQGSRPRPPTSATAGASTNARRLSRSTRSPSRPPSPNHPSAARPPQSKTSASAEVTPSVRGARKNDERSGIGQRPDSIAVQEAPTEQQSCPVCLKSLLMDNREFNAHIDFCLSRSAIRDAQAEAAGRTAGGDKGTISRRWASSSIGKGYGKGHERTTKMT
jgi:DNA polymerase kappa